MPNRIIKESINESLSLSNCSFFAQDLYKRLITYADDYGRFNADTQIMLARLYPRELDSVTEADIIEALSELAGVDKVRFYTANVRKNVYGCFPNWQEHQRVRDSKAKCPDPDDTDVNDWYLQRFIPLDLRINIIERDGFKCQICGKFITSSRDAKRLAKHGCGLYHIDHIVPVIQGGRATAENLRLTCPDCNLKRKKRFSFNEILEFAKRDDPPQVAASCGESRPESNPNPNPNPNPIQSERERSRGTRFTPPTVEEVSAYCRERGNSVDAERFVNFYAAKGWKVGKSPMVNWKAAVNTWERKEEDDGKRNSQSCDVDREKAKRSDEKWGIVYSN